MSDEELGQKLFAVLPPSMEVKDVTSVMADLKHLNAYSDTILMNHDIKICKEPSPSGSTQIEHVKRKLENYQKLYTDKDLTARYTCIDNAGVIEINTYAEVIDTNNCVTGSWAAKWFATMLSEKTANLSGEVTFHVHYYERGSNIQTRSVRFYKVEEVAAREEKVNAMVHMFQKEKMSYEEQLSKVVVNAIMERESTFYDDLQTMFNNVDQNLRKVRRILPVTKTRFKWDTAAQKQVILLNQRKAG